ncbi:MAG: transporter [Candidatus Melainabacteria bacterium RIFOXYA12_FULL_32_12]|nr:MAG: transporter [Candidatus Melainabacteria bacterium RIFOXYA2_FULL_32_9]OGI24312.1 MAG: transporter [Candidatus Melainabacteria bacterium RIFOXYA12_FULL_32_12]
MENALVAIFSHPLFVKILTAIVGIIILNFIIKLIRKQISSRISDPEARYRTRKIITFIGYFVIFLFLLVVFYERLRGLTIAFGVIGAGIAFALQEVITSIAGWIGISTEHFYRIGDRIQLGGIKGDVIDISILRTTIMELGEWVDADLYTGRIVRIANSFVFKEPVYNYSGDFPFLWDQIAIPVKYGSDYRLARQILQNIVNDIVKDYIEEAEAAWKVVRRKYLVEPARVEPMISMTANDNWAEFSIRYIVDYKRRVTTKDQLFTRILDEFNMTEGKVSVASATFQLVQAPPLDIKITEKKISD